MNKNNNEDGYVVVIDDEVSEIFYGVDDIEEYLRSCDVTEQAEILIYKLVPSGYDVKFDVSLVKTK